MIGMATLGRLFWAELVREWILLLRYPFETVARLIWNMGFAFVIFYGFGAIGGSGAGALPGFQEGQMNRLLGLLITYIAMNGLNNAVELLDRESQTGTLEQAALSPPPLVVMMLLRDLASYVELLVRFALVLAIATAVTGVRFHVDVVAIVVLLTLMYLGMEGFGLLLGGAALLYKRIATLAQFTVMMVFGLAMFPLERVPARWQWLVDGFPFTRALTLLRQVSVHGDPFWGLVRSGQVTGLLVASLGILGLGIVGFWLAEAKARDWGTLNQY